jgi:hypothetical protein
MEHHSAPHTAATPIAVLLRELEERSRARPDRVLRLRGTLPAADSLETGAVTAGEPFELLIFRGFSSLTTHPTAFDPDRPALPEGSRIETAELLQGPLDPSAPVLLAGPMAVEDLRRPEAWC